MMRPERIATEQDQLLLIAHDDECAHEILALLRDCEWRGARVATANDAYKLLGCGKFRVVMLERWLPDGDGLDILSFVRNGWPSIPAIVMSSDAQCNDRIDTFEAGADEYISVPCDQRELRARLRSLLRRAANHPNSISIRDLQLWKESRIALHSGRPIKLSRTEFDLLHCLASNHPEPVNRRTLLKTVFKLDIEPGTNILEVHIHRLRRKLDDGRTDPLLQTVRGRGYALA